MDEVTINGLQYFFDDEKQRVFQNGMYFIAYSFLKVTSRHPRLYKTKMLRDFIYHSVLDTCHMCKYHWHFEGRGKKIKDDEKRFNFVEGKYL